MIQQIADTAADNLQRAVGQNAHVDDPARDQFGQIGTGRGRFHKAGHACDQGRGDLFQHAPDGEVESIDMNRNAQHRGKDVLAYERAVLGQLFDRTFGQNAGVGQFATGLGGEGQHGADPAVDIRPCITGRGPCVQAFAVEVVFHL